MSNWHQELNARLALQCVDIVLTMNRSHARRLAEQDVLKDRASHCPFNDPDLAEVYAASYADYARRYQKVG